MAYCVRKGGEVPTLTAHLAGYIRVNADNLDHAKSLFVRYHGQINVQKINGRMSAFGPRQTLNSHSQISAFGRKADIEVKAHIFRF
jgi:hypothetical protein